MQLVSAASIFKRQLIVTGFPLNALCAAIRYPLQRHPPFPVRRFSVHSQRGSSIMRSTKLTQTYLGLKNERREEEKEKEKEKRQKPRRTTETRKRTTQLGQHASDDERTKRVKEEKTSTSSNTTPEPKRQKRRRTAAPKKGKDLFSFKTEAAAAETPRLPKKSEIESEEEEDMVVSSQESGGNVVSASSSTEAGSESDGSVSIRFDGSSKKVSKAQVRRTRRKGVQPAEKPSDALARAYVSFNPKSAAKWEPGQRVPFKALADTLAMIESTTKRLEIARYLSEFFRCVLSTTPEDLLPAVYLCVNKVGPAHEGLELGIGDSTLMKAIANVSGGGDVAKIKKQYEDDGDLGSVAVSRKGTQNLLMGFQPLSVAEVFKRFVEIAKDSGDKSQDRKRMTIERLLNASKGIETKFITRSLQGKLRIGLAEQTVLQSIGQAYAMHFTTSAEQSSILQKMEESVECVKQVYSTCPSYDQLIPCMNEFGIDMNKLPSFTPGIPVQPMLAKPTTGIAEVLEKFTDIPFTCEFKYDGERSQIHVLGDQSVRIYSRSAEDVTGKYPDIVARIPQYLQPGVRSAVLDCESVAFDRETQKILPFQRLSTRARKDVKVSNIKVPICVFCFDCLYLNGKSLLGKPLTERRQALYDTLNTEPGVIQFAEHQTSTNVEELQNFLDMAVQHSTEGLIVKTLDGTYEPSKRSVNWLKLKKDYLDGVGDSFDLVVIGAWHGKGKRTGVFGSFLLAVYDPVNDEYQSISKIGTGFSEEDLENHTKALKAIEIKRPPRSYSYGETVTPDTWFDAKIVWEVKAADLSISPVHKAANGILDDTKGISIRFPRLVRVRDDKKATDATSSEQVAQMYKQQTANVPSAF